MYGSFRAELDTSGRFDNSKKHDGTRRSPADFPVGDDVEGGLLPGGDVLRVVLVPGEERAVQEVVLGLVGVEDGELAFGEGLLGGGDGGGVR